MIIIAHRGNLDGPNPTKENHPAYIQTALEQGFHVEVDAWIVDHKVVLGHDSPQWEATKYFHYQGPWWKYNGRMASGPALWVHCKNFEALNDSWFFHGHKFSHDQDDFTLTSTGYIWTYPRNLPLGKQSIAVMPERVQDWDISNAGGVCTDFPTKYESFIYSK